MTPAQITAFGELPSVLMTYIKENYTDPYEQGQMVAYVLTSFIPVGGQLKFAKLVAKGNPKWLKFVQKLDNIPAGNITDAVNLIKGEKDLLTRLDAYPNLKTAVNNLTPTKKQQFLDDFVDASDAALTRMNNAPICLNYWKNSASGDIIGANAEAFAKQYEAMILLKQGNFTGVASLYNKSFKTVEYVLDGAPNPTVLAEARLIANRTNDIPVIAQKMGVPENIIREVKEHFFVTEHFMEINGNFQKGRFEREAEDIALWKAAESDGLVNGYSFIDITGGTQYVNASDALTEFKRLVAHEYIESKLMKEGFLYRNYLNNGDPNEFNFGAHDLSISTKWRNPNEYIMLTNYVKPKSFPTSFNNDWSKLDLIVNQLIQMFK